MSLDRHLAWARRQDRADGLAHHRARFHGADTPLVYFDGNSLGRPAVSAIERVERFLREAWGERLIRGWDEQWMELPFRIGDDIGRHVIGTAPGQTVIGDSTTVLLYKLARAAVDAQLARDPARVEIVVGSDDFPTDRYLLEGIARERGARLRWIEVARDSGVTVEQLRAAVGPETALVVLSHVAYRSGHLADAPELTRIAHDAGALVLWDLCHSAGSVPVEADAWGFDLAVGCTYKYLNAGPGAIAGAFVHSSHFSPENLDQLHGWWGHEEKTRFRMLPTFTPAHGAELWQMSNPPILSLAPVVASLELFREAGLPALRAKSADLTGYLDWLIAERFAERIACITPEGARGAQLSLRLRDAGGRGRALFDALCALNVTGDWREPDVIRVAPAPLYNSYRDVHEFADRLGTALAQG